MSGVGGSSLLAPLLILIFGFKALTTVGTDLVYSVPVSLPLSPTYSEGLQNYAALAVFRHKSVIVVSIDQGSSWRRCDASSEGDTVVSLLRSSLAALHADIWVTTTHSDDSSTVTLTS